MAPDWQGATWYGQSSGTYWTVNPKEYADPRKHGPEYQARARRAAMPDSPRTADPTAGSADATAAVEGEAGRAVRDRSWTRPTGPPRPPGGPDSPGRGASAARRGWAARPPDAASRAIHRAPRVAGVGRARPPDTLVGRVVIALIGWPIPGLIAALLIGEATGCGRYAATCPDPLGSPATIASALAQPAVIALFLAAPRLAEAAAVGAIAVAAAAVPAAVLLSASGGAVAPPGQASTILVAMLAIPYLAGIAGAALGRLRVPGFIRGRVR